MGVFGKKRVECPAGRWTTIISNFGTGMQKTFTIAFLSESHDDVSGEWEERKYMWIFPQSPTRGPIVPLMKFNRDWINAIYKVRVKPDFDIYAEFK
jgi:hypothetical protein